MRAIGIRVTPTVLYYSIAEKVIDDNVNLITTGTIVFPKALDMPRCLSFIRTTVLSILLEYDVIIAGIRITEFNSQNLNIVRLNVEGVIQELLADSKVEQFYCGTIATIARLLNAKSSEIKEVFEGKSNPFNIADWTHYSKEERESIISALAALYLN